MSEPRHQRLSMALCEAVEFGRPVKIMLGIEDKVALLASVSRDTMHKIDVAADRFEDVPMVTERDRTGCVVGHDGRYMDMAPLEPLKAIPATVAMDRRTRKPIIVAW